MPLVEGLGDEVTIILALLTIIIVLLIAWLSTHTRDIPFFSVIVVELSQRAARNQQARRSQTPDSQQESTNQNDEALVAEVETNVEEEASTLPSSVKHSVSETLRAETIQAVSVDNGTTVVNKELSETSTGGTQAVSDETSASTEASKFEETQPQNEPNLSKMNLGNGDSNDNRNSSEKMENENDDNENRDSNITRDSNVSSDSNVSETISQSQPSETSEVRHRTVPSSDLLPNSETNSPSIENTASSDFLGSASSDDGQIRIRLKYLNDTQRLVYSSPSDTIGQFRRAHFSSELAANKLVRLIFNGQDMRNDTSTLQGYNITDNSVIHCLVTQNLQGTAQPHLDQGDADLQLGSFMMPLFAFILAAMWYLRVTQRQYFNAVSTLSLAGFTFLFVLGCASMWRNGVQRDHEHVE